MATILGPLVAIGSALIPMMMLLLRIPISGTEKLVSLSLWIPGALSTAKDDHEELEVNGGPAHAGGGDLMKVESLPPGLRPELMPRHVAVIIDVNGRWARRRWLPASLGHAFGALSLRDLIDLRSKWGIRVLTVFVFSTENWSRNKRVEVQFLMGLIERAIEFKLQIYSRDGVRISIIGDSSKLPKSLQRVLIKAEQLTKQNSRFHLIFAINYSGKSDVTQACKSIAQKVKDSLFHQENIDEELIEKELATSCAQFPCPDLLIRTSGEL